MSGLFQFVFILLQAGLCVLWIVGREKTEFMDYSYQRWGMIGLFVFGCASFGLGGFKEGLSISYLMLQGLLFLGIPMLLLESKKYWKNVLWSMLLLVLLKSAEVVAMQIVTVNSGMWNSDEINPNIVCGARLVAYLVITFLVLTYWNKAILHQTKNKMVECIVAGLYVMLFLLYLQNMLFVFRDTLQLYILRANIYCAGVVCVVLAIIIYFGVEGAESDKNEQLKIRNELLSQSLKENERTINEWKESIHDYKHDLMYLQRLAEEEKHEELKQFLKRKNGLLMKEIFVKRTGNKMVDSILSAKEKEANKWEIPVTYIIKIEHMWSIGDHNMCSLLGNLLDNAIEASRKEKMPMIEVTLATRNSLLLIIVRNHFTGTLPVQETTKQGSMHGIGLQSVKRIVKENGGEYQYRMEDEVYEVYITLPMTI